MATTEVRAMAERPRQTHPGALADMVQRRLREYDTDPLRNRSDAAEDSGLSERSLRRYSSGVIPGTFNARLLMQWLAIDERRMREAIDDQQKTSSVR